MGCLRGKFSTRYIRHLSHSLVVINAPSAFGVIWKVRKALACMIAVLTEVQVVKHWLAKETQQKIDILGSDYEATLLRDIPPENLPAFLGGTCNCEHGGCANGAGSWLENRTNGQATAPTHDQLNTNGHALQTALNSKTVTTEYVEAPIAPLQQLHIARDDDRA